MKKLISMFRLSTLLFVLCSLALATQTQTQTKTKTETETQRTTSSSNWTWSQSDDGKKVEVKVENKVEFNEDYTDVSAIPDDGALRIHDSRGAQTFQLVVTRGANGELKREYSVDGRTQPFDDRGKQWLREVLLKAVREGGLDAKTRVRRILKRSGTRGLIEEMGYVKGDYVRRIYFEEFLQVPGLSDADLKSALRNASTTIDGDYERAQLLLQVGSVFLGKRELIPDYFEAVNRFKSAYEHHRVLSGALKRDDLPREALSALVLSAAKIDSDYEKATFLIKAASRYQADEVLRKDWLSALRTVGSDYEHHCVLSGALKAPELSNEALLSLVESAARMASDYEKASFLIEALGHYQPNASLRAAFVNTAKTINSEYERGRVQKRMDKQDF